MRPSPERLGRAVAWLLVPLVLVTLDAGCTLLPRRPAAPDAEVSGTGSIGPAPAPVPLGELPPLARTGEGPPSPQSVSVPPPVAEVGTTSGASDPAVRKVSGSSDPRAQAMVALLLDNDSEAPPPSPTEAEPIIAPAPVPTLTLETVEGPTAGPSSESEPPTATVDEALRHVDCLTCGGTGHLADLGTCLSCGGGGQCVPGRKPCYPYEYHTTVGRFFGMIYECLCCPDPCYEPTWVPEANAAFFVDYARPKTVTRIRYDFFNNLQFPDRAEYFWAEAALNRTGQPVGRGPTPPSFRYPNLRGMPYNRGFPAIDMSQVSLYTEAATKRAAFFFEFPYRSLQVIPQPPFNPNNLTLLRHAAGFSDMNLGTKSLLLDCELLQLTFQFRTFLPLGNVTKGLGNGHVSLEPSLLGTLKLGPQTYLQGQISEWVPLGGDPDYQGAILHYHGSLNQVLYRFTPDVPLIGTLECSGWSFQDGLYTDPVLGPVPASGGTYFNVGPGLRMSICKKVDFGGAVAWPVSDFHWADPLVRAEIRILY